MKLLFFLVVFSSSLFAAKPHNQIQINENSPIWQSALSELPRNGKWKLQMNAFPVNGQYDLHRYTTSDRICYEKSLNFDKKSQLVVHRMKGNQRLESSGVLSCCFETDDMKREKITKDKSYILTKRGDLAVGLKSFTLEPAVAQNLEGRKYTYFKVIGGDPDLFHSLYCTQVNENGQMREAKLIDLYGLFMSHNGNRGSFELKPDAI